MSFTLFQELLEQSDSEAERSSASGRRVWRVAVLLGGLALVAAAVWSVGRSKVRSGSRDSVDLGSGRIFTSMNKIWTRLLSYVKFLNFEFWGSCLWGFRPLGYTVTFEMINGSWEDLGQNPYVLKYKSCWDIQKKGNHMILYGRNM